MPRAKKDRKRASTKAGPSSAPERDNKKSKSIPFRPKKDTTQEDSNPLYPFAVPVKRDNQDDLDPCLRNDLCKLPPEIRIIIYSYVLHTKSCIRIAQAPLAALFSPTGLRLRTAIDRLFLLSKLISWEARQVFYSENRFYLGLQNNNYGGGFDLLLQRLQRFEEFINTIGPTNAGYIRRVQIDWPNVGRLSSEPMFVDAADRELLNLLRTKCPNVRTIVFSQVGLIRLHIKLWNYRSHEICDKCLRFIDSQIRAIPSVREICIDTHPHRWLGSGIQPDQTLWMQWVGIFADKIRELGWKIL